MQNIIKNIKNKYYNILDTVATKIARCRGGQYLTREKLISNNERVTKASKKSIKEKQQLIDQKTEAQEKYSTILNKYNKLKDSIITYPPDKIKLKAWAARVRDSGKCDICESTNNLSAHHLWDKKTHPSLMYQDQNGVCLCTECHNQFHAMYTAKSHVTPAMYQKFKIIKQNEKVYSKQGLPNVDSHK
jgi:5-methylcytosine-specific restriction endonuclease McrA